MSDNKQAPHWVGFDLGGTKMLASVYDDEFNLRSRKRKRTVGHGNVDAGLERITKTLHKAVEEAGIDPRQIAGIGIGFPGPVNMETGELLAAVNLGWQGMPLKEALQQEFDCGVVIANDVDLGVYGEYRFGAAQDANCALGIFPGTGIGGGCVYDGKILRGKFSSCMEIGHFPVNTNGQLCGCGKYGCLETEASRMAVSAQAAKAAYRGEAPHLKEIAGTDLSEIRSGQLAEAVKKGDVVIEQILRSAGEKIGVVLAGVITLICPDVIVMGGGLIEAMPELLVETVYETARETVMPPYKDVFRVAAAQLGDDATVKGAAAWAEECLSKRAKKFS